MEDTFVRIVVKKTRYKGKISFKTWLYAIGRNITVDYLRKNAGIAPISTEELLLLADDTENVERAYIKDEEKLKPHKALKELNDDYRKVLYLIYFEEFSIAETASVIKKSYKQTEIAAENVPIVNPKNKVLFCKPHQNPMIVTSRRTTV